MLILNEAKPKYDHLNEIFETKLLDIRFSSNINIFIDLKDILRKFFRPDITAENFNKKNLIEEILSDIINTVGHYRNYFYKKGKYTTFFILNSMTEVSTEFEETFRKEFYEKYILDNGNDSFKKEVIRGVNKCLPIICREIAHVTYINSADYTELVYAKFILEKIKDNELNIILSNDIMFYQLIRNNVVLMTLKGIKSELITEDNVMYKLTECETTLSKNAIPLILSLSGVKKYSIDKIETLGIKKSVKIIEYLSNVGKYLSTDSFLLPVDLDKLDGNIKSEKIIISNIDKINRNYLLIRGDTLLNRNRIHINNKIPMPKKTDIEVLKTLNSKFFSIYPINLDMIMKGEN